MISNCGGVSYKYACSSRGGFEINDNCHISIIIPVYNENNKLKEATETILRTLSGMKLTSELIIAEDGSDDGSYELATELVAKNPSVYLQHSEERQGRGCALSRAIKVAKGEVVCYIDADLATDMSYLPPLIDAVLCDGYDFATGSRLMSMSDTSRSHTRSIASKTYNLIVRLLLRSKVHDHQCGFKAFRRASILQILDQVRDGHWFWDTEVLVRGQREGYKIKEIPVRWNEADETKVCIYKDVYGMGSQIIRLWWDLIRNKEIH